MHRLERMESDWLFTSHRLQSFASKHFYAVGIAVSKKAGSVLSNTQYGQKYVTGVLRQYSDRSKRIPSIFKDESTGSRICLRSLICTCHTYRCYAYHFYAYRLYFINVWHVYVSPKTYTWSGAFILKDGRYTFTFCSLFPYPSTNRSHTCAYVTCMKDNVSRSFEMRHVIHDTRISSGNWPRCDVTNGTCVTLDFQGHTK
jgi:hypothetical protein